MSVLPTSMQKQIFTKFKNIRGNFEFGTWVITYNLPKILKEAKSRGIAAWKSIDSKCSFLYGVLIVKNSKDVEENIKWLQEITFSHKKIQVLINNPKRPYLELYCFRGKDKK